jgi:hypothetical protein
MEREIRQKINLLQYFDPLIIPIDTFVIDDDVFYDTRNDLQEQQWMLSDPIQTIAITSTTVNLLIDSIDVLSHYENILSFEDVSFFNTSYRRLEPTTALYGSLLIQARHLKAQVFHYDTTSTGFRLWRQYWR